MTNVGIETSKHKEAELLEEAYVDEYKAMYRQHVHTLLA